MRAGLLSALMALSCVPQARPQQSAREPLDMKSAFTTADFSALPALPDGRSTALGGQITHLDPVLDQFTLRIFGEKPMKILFDERTQVFRDGKRVPLGQLGSEQHASVQTVLERGNVFAMSVHLLSNLPHGECEGYVKNYDATTGELTIASSMSREPVRLWLRPGTQVARQGQGAFTSGSAGPADLVDGTLVTATFDAGDKGRPVASRVTVLAKPGSAFAFSGKISSLDMHAGTVVLVDPRDQKRYEIAFDPGRFPVSGNLHVGDEVRVSAAFDGTRYSAVEIAQIQAAQ